MPDKMSMQRTECRQNRHKKLPSQIPAQASAAAFHKIAQSDAFLPLGDRISRIVFFKNIVNLNNRRKFTHVRNSPEIAEELFAAFAISGFAPFQDLDSLSIRVAFAQGGRKEFMQFNRRIQHSVQSDIEGPFPIAVLYRTNGIPVLQNRTERKGTKPLRFTLAVTAHGADILPTQIGHAVHTQIFKISHATASCSRNRSSSFLYSVSKFQIYPYPAIALDRPLIR